MLSVPHKGCYGVLRYVQRVPLKRKRSHSECICRGFHEHPKCSQWLQSSHSDYRSVLPVVLVWYDHVFVSCPVYKNFTSTSTSDATNFNSTGVDLSTTNHLRFRVKGDLHALLALSSVTSGSEDEVLFHIALADGQSDDVTITSNTNYETESSGVTLINVTHYNEFWLKWNSSEVNTRVIWRLNTEPFSHHSPFA